MPKPIVNIDPFATVAGTVTTGGVKHDVLHLNGREYRTLNASNGGTLLECYDIAARLVPTLDTDTLTGAQVGAIIGIADGRITEVESQFPNFEGPTTTEPPAPA